MTRAAYRNRTETALGLGTAKPSPARLNCPGGSRSGQMSVSGARAHVLLVVGFTYARLPSGMVVYTAFRNRRLRRADRGVVLLASKEDRFVPTAIGHAAQLRVIEDDPLSTNTIHQRIARSQGGFN